MTLIDLQTKINGHFFGTNQFLAYDLRAVVA